MYRKVAPQAAAHSWTMKRCFHLAGTQKLVRLSMVTRSGSSLKVGLHVMKLHFFFISYYEKNVQATLTSIVFHLVSRFFGCLSQKQSWGLTVPEKRDLKIWFQWGKGDIPASFASVLVAWTFKLTAASVCLSTMSGRLSAAQWTITSGWKQTFFC